MHAGIHIHIYMLYRKKMSMYYEIMQMWTHVFKIKAQKAENILCASVILS